MDPGTTQSALLLWDGQKIHYAQILPNDEIMTELRAFALQYIGPEHTCAIERFQAMGMTVGREVFDTCIFVGRLAQLWEEATGKEARLIYRREVKQHLCFSDKAKDSNIRQALVDRFGKPGTRKSPGPVTYGLHDDLWSAFAISVTTMDKLNATIPGCTTPASPASVPEASGSSA